LIKPGGGAWINIPGRVDTGIELAYTVTLTVSLPDPVLSTPTSTSAIVLEIATFGKTLMNDRATSCSGLGITFTECETLAERPELSTTISVTL